MLLCVREYVQLDYTCKPGLYLNVMHVTPIYKINGHVLSEFMQCLCSRHMLFKPNPCFMSRDCQLHIVDSLSRASLSFTINTLLADI